MFPLVLPSRALPWFVHSDGPEGPPLLHRLVVDWVVEELPSATLSPTDSAHVCSVFLGVQVGSSCLNYLVHSRVVVHMAATESTTLMVFLSRFSPVPNIVINLASPLVGVPLPAFVVGSFFGMMPMNFVHLMTGKALANADRISKWPALLILATGFILVLIFVMYEKSRTRTHVT